MKQKFSIYRSMGTQFFLVIAQNANDMTCIPPNTAGIGVRVTTTKEKVLYADVAHTMTIIKDLPTVYIDTLDEESIKRLDNDIKSEIEPEKQPIWALVITYNYNSEYIAMECESKETAINLLLVCINNDIKTIRVEEQYDPSVLAWSKDNVTLVHAANYTTEDESYKDEDCAYYRVMKIERKP